MKITFTEPEVKEIPPFDYGTVWEIDGFEGILYFVANVRGKVLVVLDDNGHKQFSEYFDDAEVCGEYYYSGKLKYVGKISEVVIENT